jgi:hypothetical protein
MQFLSRAGHDNPFLTLSKSITSASIPLADNFHTTAYARSTMKPIHATRPTRKSEHDAHGQLCLTSASRVPHRTGAIRHASFRSNSVAITVPKLRENQHLTYLIFLANRRLQRRCKQKSSHPTPRSPIRCKNIAQKRCKSRLVAP